MFENGRKPIVILIIVLTIASFLRLWQLDSIPPGLYADVAINGNDALSTLQTGNAGVFYPENNGREGLLIWLIAASFSVFGVSVWAIKVVAAVCGVLTVLGLYLLTRELFKVIDRPLSASNECVALLGSFLLSVSFWHINFSRIGFRAILLPFVLVFSFYFLFRGLNSLKGKRSLSPENWVLAGLFFGLGFYTYTPFRLAVLMIPIVLIPGWFVYRKERLHRKFLLGSTFFLVTVFLVALPMGIYFLQNPHDFVSRATGVSVFSQDDVLRAFGNSLSKHLLMFVSDGDNNWRHNFAGGAILPPFMGVLMYLGILIGVMEIVRSSIRRAWSTLLAYSFLIGWFVAMLLPSVLTIEGIPHALRSIGVVPVAYIFVVIGIVSLKEPLKRILFGQTAKRYVPAFLLACIVVLTGYLGYHRYFVDWARSPDLHDAFTVRFVDMGHYLNSLPSETGKYVIVNEFGVPVPWPAGVPMPGQTPMFIESTEFGHPRSVYLLSEHLDQITVHGETVIIPMRADEPILNILTERFPQGAVNQIGDITVYEVR